MNQEWWLEGDLFEGCNCSLLCPCHVSFRQRSENPWCDNIWALSVERGQMGNVDLACLGVAVFVHCPGPTMADGDWTAVLYIDERATDEQFAALRGVFTGESGGPWATIAQFFKDGEYSVVRKMPLEITIDTKSRSMKASDRLFLEVKAIRGADREGVATITNLRNVIHGPEQVMAHSNHKVDGEGLGWEIEGKHGLYSRFRWTE